MTITQTLATALISAHQTGTRAEASTLPQPDFATALAVHEIVQAALGPVCGFKVAARPDGPPVIAPIPASRSFVSGGAVAVEDTLGIEMEIGFELIAPPADDMMSRPQDFFRPLLVLELVDTRVTGDGANAPLMKLADMQINAGLVTGPALDGWDGTDFGTVRGALRCGGTQVVEGALTVPGGSAVSNLALFCDNIGDHCGGLQKGQIVITGSLSGLAYFPSGTDVHGEVEGFGSIDFQLS